MSLPTWTPDALRSELRPYERHVWRVVEAQHVISTRKIVDSNTEQSLLEDLIEAAKPPFPAECAGLHFLLKTPFRYGAVYPMGSRFRRAGHTTGVFYAAEDPHTAVAEMAFYRLLFFAESPATPWPVNPAEYTGFSSAARTSRSLDLARPPIDADKELWRHPVDYAPCQAVAEAGREAGAEILRYGSVRDPQGGACVAVLTCAAFAEREPLAFQTWRIGVGENGAYAIREFPRAQIEFDRMTFASDPRFAWMEWKR
jgi:RES domain